MAAFHTDEIMHSDCQGWAEVSQKAPHLSSSFTYTKNQNMWLWITIKRHKKMTIVTR